MARRSASMLRVSVLFCSMMAAGAGVGRGGGDGVGGVDGGGGGKGGFLAETAASSSWASTRPWTGGDGGGASSTWELGGPEEPFVEDKLTGREFPRSDGSNSAEHSLIVSILALKPDLEARGLMEVWNACWWLKGSSGESGGVTVTASEYFVLGSSKSSKGASRSSSSSASSGRSPCFSELEIGLTLGSPTSGVLFGSASASSAFEVGLGLTSSPSANSS